MPEKSVGVPPAVGHDGHYLVFWQDAVFIGAQGNQPPRSQWFEILADRPVLTITEHVDALGAGAMLSFVSDVEGGQARIRFEASLQAMQRAGLVARSQMLVAARKVHRDRVEEPQ